MLQTLLYKKTRTSNQEIFFNNEHDATVGLLRVVTSLVNQTQSSLIEQCRLK
jgi:hypothetical protein